MLYAIFDITDMSTTRVIAKAPYAECELIGAIQREKGRRIISPMLTPNGLNSLSYDTLAYAVWNTWNTVPLANKDDLITQLLGFMARLPVDPTPIGELEKILDELGQSGDEPSRYLQPPPAGWLETQTDYLDEPPLDTPVVQPPPEPVVTEQPTPLVTYPKEGTTGYKLWILFDAQAESFNRVKFIAAAIEAGFNKTTATANLKKWCEAKGVTYA